MTVDDVLARTGVGDVAAHLDVFLRRQRWFGGRGRELLGVEAEDATVLLEGHDPGMVLLLARVRYGDGETERYNLPLGIRPESSPVIKDWPERHVAAGVLGGERVTLYDALGDPECAWELWRRMLDGGRVATAHGEVAFRSLALRPAPDGRGMVRPLAREQSNTSVLRDDSELLKCFRRIDEGPSPELEMTQALASVGFRHIAAPVGAVEYLRGDDQPVLLCLVQEYLHNATEGWTLALTSLRDLYADAETEPEMLGDPEVRERAVADQGGAFTPEAARLGDVTAEMHIALASPELPVEMRGEPATPQVLGRWADEMTEELDHLLAGGAEALQTLRARRPDILARFDALRGLAEPGVAIRVHGDYHLGQVLRTDAGWTVLDFEGEPARPLQARRLRSSPLRDVAGMLRSFDYAAAACLAERVNPTDPDFERMIALGETWAAANREAFWSAYARRAEEGGILPDLETALTLRRAFEMQKAVYEVGYELGHRPDWVGIPLRFLLRETLS